MPGDLEFLDVFCAAKHSSSVISPSHKACSNSLKDYLSSYLSPTFHCNNL